MPFQIQIKDALEFFGTINFDDFRLLNALAAGQDSMGPVIPTSPSLTPVDLVNACLEENLREDQVLLFSQNKLLENASFIDENLPNLNNLSAALKNKVCKVGNLGAFLKNVQNALTGTCFARVLGEATSDQAKTTFLRKDHSTLVLEYILSQSDVQSEITALKEKFQGWVRDRNLCNNVEFVKIYLPRIIADFKAVIFSKCSNLDIGENILSDLNKDTNSPAGYPQNWIDQTDQNILAYLAGVNLTVSSRGNGMSQSQTVWGEKFSGAGYPPQKSVHIELEFGHYQAMLTTDNHKKQKVNVPGDGYCGYHAFSLGLMAVECPAYKEQVLQPVSSSGRGASTTTGKHKKGPRTSTEGRFLDSEAIRKYNGDLTEEKAMETAIRKSLQEPVDMEGSRLKAKLFVDGIKKAGNVNKLVKALNAFKQKKLVCEFKKVNDAERKKAQFAVDYLSGSVLREGQNFEGQLQHALSIIHQLSPDAFETVTRKYFPKIFVSYALKQESEKKPSGDLFQKIFSTSIAVRA